MEGERNFKQFISISFIKPIILYTNNQIEQYMWTYPRSLHCHEFLVVDKLYFLCPLTQPIDIGGCKYTVVRFGPSKHVLFKNINYKINIF